MTEQQQADEQPTGADEVGAEIGASLGSAIAEQLMVAFWAPTPSQPRVESVMGVNGQPQTIMVPQFHGPSPLDSAVRVIWQTHGDAIVKRVVEQIDVADLVERIAAQTVDALTKEPSSGWGYGGRMTPTAENVRNQVRDKVATLVSRNVADQYEAQQTAMFEAWQTQQREQAERERLAALDPGPRGARIEVASEPT